MIKMKTIILTIFTSCSFTQFVDNSMNINSIPTSAESSAMGGIYIPFDFNENIYGETLNVDVIRKIREEKKFKNIEALKTQITKDCIKATQMLSE